MSIIDDIGRQEISLDQGYVDLSGDINSRVNQAEKILGPLEAQTEILKKLSALLDVVDEELYEYPESRIAFQEWIKQGLALVDQIGIPTDKQELERIFTQFFGSPPSDVVAPDASTAPDSTEEEQEVPAPEVDAEAAPITPEGDLVEPVAPQSRKKRSSGIRLTPYSMSVKMKSTGKPRSEAAPEATPVDTNQKPYVAPPQGHAVLARAFRQNELPADLAEVLAIGDPDWATKHVRTKGLPTHVTYEQDLARGAQSNIRQQVKDILLVLSDSADRVLSPKASRLRELIQAHPASTEEAATIFRQWGLDLDYDQPSA